jgi:hypothetical protein
MSLPPDFASPKTLEYAGFRFAIAQVDEIPWPTSTGGNTEGACPLQEFTHDYYLAHQREPAAVEVFENLKTNRMQIPLCHHHRFSREDLKYIAELTCDAIEHDLQPHPSTFDALIHRDGRNRTLADEAAYYFQIPMRWSFSEDDQLSNGRHRLCAFKVAGAKRIAVAISP